MRADISPSSSDTVSQASCVCLLSVCVLAFAVAAEHLRVGTSASASKASLLNAFGVRGWCVAAKVDLIPLDAVCWNAMGCCSRRVQSGGCAAALKTRANRAGDPIPSLSENNFKKKS